VDVVASQYLIAYVLIHVMRRFHAANRRSVALGHTEHEIEEALRASVEFSFGVAAPYESSPDLEYRHLFAMPWSLIAPPGHKLLKKRRLKLADLSDEPLIFYERGSTGRQHVVEAFAQQGIAPHVEIEATNTDLIVRMVEAGWAWGSCRCTPVRSARSGRHPSSALKSARSTAASSSAAASTCPLRPGPFSNSFFSGTRTGDEGRQSQLGTFLNGLRRGHF
jgi:DNA-binding transcriptional LysR family regulator